MCKINCSGGCPECAPEDHTLESLVSYLRARVAELEGVEQEFEEYMKRKVDEITICERAFKSMCEELAALKKSQQAASEPVAWRCKWKDGILPVGHPQAGWQIMDHIHPSNRDSMIIEPLYTQGTQAQPPTILEDVAKDAARYRWLRDVGQDMVEVFFATNKNDSGWGCWDSWDDKDLAIDKTILSAAPQPTEEKP